MNGRERKIVLITGGSGGLGRTLALETARHGVTVNAIYPDTSTTSGRERAPK